MNYPNPTSGGPPLRALAMVLIALAIVFAGLGAMSMSSSDSDGEESAAPTTTSAAAPAATTTTTAAPATTATTTVASTPPPPPPPEPQVAAPPAPAVDRAVPVRVLNNSLVAGLANRTANQLAANGWTNVTAGNYAAGTLAKTTVYYGNSAAEREAALAIAQELGAVAEPKSAGVGDGSAGVIVILTGN